MPDFVRLAASGASGVYLGTVIRPDGVNWGSEVVMRNYNESANAYGGNLAFVNTPLRRIELPFIFSGTGPDQAHQFISTVQGQIVQGGGAILDVQFENASFLTRFDVMGGQIVDESPLAYRRAGVYMGTLKLETMPFGYSPTIMLAGSIAASGPAFSFRASVIGDVPAPFLLFIQTQTASGFPSLLPELTPGGGFLSMQYGGAAYGSWMSAPTSDMSVFYAGSPGAVTSASWSAVNQWASTFFGIDQRYLSTASFYGNVTAGTSLYGAAASNYPLFWYIATTNPGLHSHIFLPYIPVSPSAPTFSMWTSDINSGLRSSKKVTVTPRGPSAVSSYFEMLDFGEVAVSMFLGVTLNGPYQTVFMADFAGVGPSAPSIGTWAYIFGQPIIVPSHNWAQVVSTPTWNNSFGGVPFSGLGAIGKIQETATSWIVQFGSGDIPYQQGFSGGRAFIPPSGSIPHVVSVVPFLQVPSAASWMTNQSPARPVSFGGTVSRGLAVSTAYIQYSPRWIFVR